MKKLLYIALFSGFLLCTCQRPDNTSILQRADAIAKNNPDSAMTLLSTIKNVSRLPYEEQMLYGWLRAYVHYRWNFSTLEDSLILPAFDYYTTRKDTNRMLISYQLKADYLTWKEKYENAIAVLDSGIARALACKDTTLAVRMLSEQANKYVYMRQDYGKAVESLRKAISLRKDMELYYTQGISMALHGDDSAGYYMDKGVELVMQKGDTLMAAHCLRNYAQVLSSVEKDPRRAIDVVKRLEKISKDEKQLSMSYMVLTDSYLMLDQLDSAEYYLEKAKVLFARSPKSLTPVNMVSHYQAMIDYTRRHTFDFLHVMRYNDSLWNAMWAHHNISGRKEESKNYLSQVNLQLQVERQRTQLVLLFTLLMLLIVGGGSFFYIRNRRNRLIEAEERIETLNRLLAETTKATEDADVQESAAEIEDGYFFRKILLQQLGIIRLVATQPTSQNQELLRRISGITNKELPVESLLVWEDLYPVIDRVYNGFYSLLSERFGSLLTDKELQLCCLLCAEFSTKEISVVTQQSIPTIYQRKTTIRKKLGMEEKEDIIEFVLAA